MAIPSELILCCPTSSSCTSAIGIHANIPLILCGIQREPVLSYQLYTSYCIYYISIVFFGRPKMHTIKNIWLLYIRPACAERYVTAGAQRRFCLLRIKPASTITSVPQTPIIMTCNGNPQPVSINQVLVIVAQATNSTPTTVANMAWRGCICR